MFHAKLEAKTWKKIIHALSGIIEEVNILVTPEGIQFTAMDPSHISMVDFHMGKEHFEEFNGEAETTLGLDIDEQRKVINRSKPGDLLTIDADQSTIKLTLQDKERDIVRKFSLPLIDVITGEKYKVPHLDSTAKIRLPSYVFDDAIKDAYLLSDNVMLQAIPHIFLVTAEGDSGKFTTEIKDWLEYEVTEQCKSIFNLSYLTDVAKTIEDEVTINLGNDMPMKIEFTLDNAKIIFILAPRVEKDGE